MSEIELVLQIIKRECRKLNGGFEASIDIKNLRTASQTQDQIISKIKKVLRLLGAEKIGCCRTTTGKALQK